MSLSDRIRPNVEAAPWVVDEVKAMEDELKRLRSPDGDPTEVPRVYIVSDYRGIVLVTADAEKAKAKFWGLVRSTNPEVPDEALEASWSTKFWRAGRFHSGIRVDHKVVE